MHATVHRLPMRDPGDVSRGYLTQSLKLLLRAHAERPLYIFSGGTEGVLSPFRQTWFRRQ
jgi:hypothetical protein